MMNRFQKKLKRLEEESRLRSLNLPGGIDLTSNDYLGMRSHPALREAALAAIESGIDPGAGGSRLLRGHTEEHARLEAFTARHFGSEKALYFATGYQANMALFTTLPSRRDVIIFDALIHASARDGIQASHARHVRVEHNDLDGFEEALKKAQDEAEHIWIAVESLYSMDGDLADLQALQALALEYGAYLIMDEAHATGVLGAQGKGLAHGLSADNLITLHTCGKALGVAGGLVCAPGEIIDYLVNTARPFIYSTAPPPLQAHLTQKSLEIVASEDGQARRDRLKELCRFTRSKLGGEGTHIVPVILGDDNRTVQIASDLQSQGYDIRAIRPPSVPEGTARLRLSLSSELNEDILNDFCNRLAPWLIDKAA